MADTEQDGFDYTLQVMTAIADNAYRVAIDRKFKLERQLAQLQEELRMQEISIERMGRILGNVQSRTRRY